MKKLMMATFAMAAMMVSAPAAFADDCKGLDQYSQRIVQEYNNHCKKNCEKKQEHQEVLRKMGEFWRDIAGNSWAKAGPRNFSFGITQKGTIQSITKRNWVSTSTTDQGSVTVKIDKTEGQGALDYNICLLDPETGKAERVAFGDFGKSNGLETQTKRVAKTQGKFVIVEMVGKTAARKFAYEITVTETPARTGSR
jgi:hypothetical protein